MFSKGQEMPPKGRRRKADAIGDDEKDEPATSAAVTKSARPSRGAGKIHSQAEILKRSFLMLCIS